MSDTPDDDPEIIDVCPECDAGKVTANAVGGTRRCSPNKSKGKYRCCGCGAYFDDPARREAKGHRDGGSALASKLSQADPGDWP